MGVELIPIRFKSNIIMKQYVVIIPIVIICLLGSCAFNVETSRRIRQAAKYTDQIPITVAELKQMILDDTTHYKVVVVYYIGCQPCTESLKKYAAPLYNNADTSQLRFYFVQNHCGALKKNKEYLESCDISAPMYYLRDDTPEFSGRFPGLFKSWNDEQNNNIAHYIFPGCGINGSYGYPMHFIIDKHNHVKLQVNRYSDAVLTLVPADLFAITAPIDSIDFYAIDTVQFEYNSYKVNNSKCKKNKCDN